MMNFNEPLQIGTVTIPNRVILAPLAGVSDTPFRRICQEHGAGLSYIEMLSATAVIHGSRRTNRMINRHPTEPLLGVQVTGPTPELISEAINRLDQLGFDTIDINMGCPVRKIVNKGWGSAILKDQERLSAIVQASRTATSKPLSVKCRIGYEKHTVNVKETAHRVHAAGAEMIAIHGRTRADDYSVPIHYEAIREALENTPDIVSAGNGNVVDYDSACMMMEQTGCDAVMVSRGALGNPWIFGEILGGKPNHPCPDEWLDVVLRHLEYHEEHYGESRITAITARKHLLWYTNGFPEVRRVREALSVIPSLDEARDLLKKYVRWLPKNLRRYEAFDGDLKTFDPKYEMDRKYDAAVAG